MLVVLARGKLISLALMLAKRDQQVSMRLSKELEAPLQRLG